MRVRVLALAAVTAGVVVYLIRAVGGSGYADRPLDAPRVARRVPAPAAVVAGAASPPRNVFEYADGAPRAAEPAPPRSSVAAAPVPAAPEPSPSPAVRLVGLLHRGGQVKAALTIAGETVVLAAGESAGGYTVTSIDEDEGIRLRGPDGSTVVLTAGPD